MLYLFFKWLHIVAIISWMAGILYLIRLFVNHVERGRSSRDNHDLLCLMEQRLYRIIIVPAMSISWLAGGAMITLVPSLLIGGWLHVKLVAVIMLTGLTLHCGRMIHKFTEFADDTLPTSRFLRILNEVPTILMLIIVGMVVFKPF